MNNQSNSNMSKKQYKPVPDVDCLRYKGTPEKPDIKIFVSHRIDLESETIDNPLYVNVRCGAVYDERDPDRINGMLGDDTGDNISEKRENFCELTVQYWAWKNVEADYYGLCHYRRYFLFADHDLQTEPGGWTEYSRITETVKNETGNKGVINDYKITKYDITVGNSFHTEIPLYEQWREYPFLHGKDLEHTLNIIREIYPDYYKTAKEYFSNKIFYPCNMFIMKRDIFLSTLNGFLRC